MTVKRGNKEHIVTVHLMVKCQYITAQYITAHVYRYTCCTSDNVWLHMVMVNNMLIHIEPIIQQQF